MADLRVRMWLDGAAFMQGVTSMRQGLNTTFSGLQSQLAAAFSVGAITALSHRTIEYAGRMRDMSDRLGVNVEWLQKMANSAALAGGSVEDLANMMGKLAQSREDALTDPKSNSGKALSRLGFSSSDIRNMPQQKFFERLVASFAGGASVQMENDVTEVGGKAAKNLLASFAAGFHETGSVMPEWLIDELDNAGDALTRLGHSLMFELAPALAFTIEQIQKLTNRLIQASAGAGGLTAFVNPKDWAKAAEKGLGVPYLYTALAKGWKSMQDETNEVAVKQEERDDSLKIAQEAARKRRRERENSPPNFNITPKEEKDKLPKINKADIKSDSLIAVGNFLGATNRSNIEGIQRETNNLIKETNRILSRIEQLRGMSVDSLGLPNS